ncbi:alpha/beta hydrolase [Microbacterium sp. ASV49]|uniref:Esterase n=1 Tax=Microbacterium candidum TaxID=3041922 RepID=A0ABT7N0U8_9MICO|nr:esterase [Microbacterium sp. ASV49]MDL9980334.1 esterase [Microbacterium sp. ASV49]
MDVILSIPVLNGPLPVVLYTVALAFAAYLLVRRPSRGRLVASSVGILIGAIAAVATFVISNVTSAFGEQLEFEVLWWATAGFAAAGLAMANLWRSRWWRKLLAALGGVVFLAASAVGINAVYGLDPTIGEMLGVSAPGTLITIPIPKPVSTTVPAWVPSDGSLYLAWRAPRNMPVFGRQGYVSIPAAESGFSARPAGLYLPPAALVPDPPPLPLVILMMGFPGQPGPEAVAAVVDRYQQKHQGLGPIVLVADQIGTQGDPMCADSKQYGKAQTYITKDVINWARQNLHIIQDPDYWALMGYSNGGGCAIKYGALMPSTFRNIVDISGEPFPGSEDSKVALQRIFQGNKAAFEAGKPVNIMRNAKVGSYAGVNAVFTYGAADGVYSEDQKTMSDVARSVGMSVTLTEIAGAAHSGPAFSGGVAAGLHVLCPLWGLSASSALQ